jgi:predicted nucleotide-binding protein
LQRQSEFSHLTTLSEVNMMKIFVASSTAAKPQAKAFIKGCSRADIEFLPWWDQFTGGKTNLVELMRIRKQIDRTIVILSPESDTKLRGRKQPIPNLNVLFEFGFFYGTLGPDHVAVVRYGQFYLPSDLGGYIHINGSKRFARGAAVKVGKQTKTEFERWLDAPKKAKDAALEAIYAKGNAQTSGATK